MAVWLTAVLVGTGIAGLLGRLPGVEPAPYIIRFTEDRPNPIYRRVCYTLAWSELIAFAVLNMAGLLPRVKPSTKGEGHERRYFYGSAWAVLIAQPALGVLWKLLPQTRSADTVKLVIFVAILAYVGNLARRGLLPRTRPIVPGELAVSD